MKKSKMKYILIVLIVSFLSLISISLYTEFNGYPWKHAQIKKEAVDYMKEKYNMDVKVVGSFFNFKFDYYTAEVYNVKDAEKNVIRVEKQRFYDEKTQGRGERLEDNYSKVYWEKRMNSELQEKYPNFFKLNDVEKMNMDIAYFTTPLDKGVSSIKDENGIYIPLKPELNGIMQIDLKTNDLSEEFLKELLSVTKDIASIQTNLVIRGKNEENSTGNNSEKTTILNLEYEKIKDISSVEDLKKEISDLKGRNKR